MIDDATILEKAHRMATKYNHMGNEPYLFNPRHIVDFARAIEQLARQEQREADARICEAKQDEWDSRGDNAESCAAMHIAESIRAAGSETPPSNMNPDAARIAHVIRAALIW